MKQQYILSNRFTMLTGQSIKFLAKTDGHIVTFNPMSITSTVAPISLSLYENPTFSDVGLTTVTGNTRNRMSTETHSVIIYSTPTTPDTPELIGGVLLYDGLAAGTRQTGGSITKAYDLVLDTDQYYLYVIKNDSNHSADVSIDFSWTEVPK